VVELISVLVQMEGDERLLSLYFSFRILCLLFRALRQHAFSHAKTFLLASTCQEGILFLRTLHLVVASKVICKTKNPIRRAQVQGREMGQSFARFSPQAKTQVRRSHRGHDGLNW
jgi:hypothetical protein